MRSLSETINTSFPVSEKNFFISSLLLDLPLVGNPVNTTKGMITVDVEIRILSELG